VHSWPNSTNARTQRALRTRSRTPLRHHCGIQAKFACQHPDSSCLMLVSPSPTRGAIAISIARVMRHRRPIRRPSRLALVEPIAFGNARPLAIHMPWVGTAIDRVARAQAEIEVAVGTPVSVVKRAVVSIIPDRIGITVPDVADADAGIASIQTCRQSQRCSGDGKDKEDAFHSQHFVPTTALGETDNSIRLSDR